jgi:hypothetical protein
MENKRISQRKLKRKKKLEVMTKLKIENETNSYAVTTSFLFCWRLVFQVNGSLS